MADSFPAARFGEELPHDSSRPGPKELSGAEIVVEALEREGVQVLFAYPGGASMAMHQALTRSRKIRTVLPRHEQGGVFMAEGYARATGRAGVCMATSGPGATNLVTGIADAYMDSVPLIAITGQVKRDMIGKGAFQETDVFGITLPIVKHSYLVLDARDLPFVFRDAFAIAQTGRPGPVVIDIPKDVQQSVVRPYWPERPRALKTIQLPKAPDDVLRHILELIDRSERPLLYVGGGIITSNAAEALLRFAERTGIPVTTTLMGIGAFPETHPLSLKWLGMHGTVYANFAADQCDLLLALGVRFDDRVTGKVEEFAKRATIVHVDVDPSELNKNKPVHVPVLSDVRYALERWNQLLAEEDRPRRTFAEWLDRIGQWRKMYPLRYREPKGKIMPQRVVQELCRLTKGEAILTTGVGQHQMWAAQYYTFTRPRTFLSSSGLGAMGFGFPAALGAKLACPGRQVVDVDGDGSFLMNIQELATAVAENIPAKVIILNNGHLGMVVQWEDRFFEGNRAHTFLGNPRNPSEPYPDYVAIAQGFGVKAERIRSPEELVPALERLLESSEPYVLDVIVPYTEHVLPMIPAGGTVRDIILEPMD